MPMPLLINTAQQLAQGQRRTGIQRRLHRDGRHLGRGATSSNEGGQRALYERKRQDRSARRAEKRRRLAKMLRLLGSIRPNRCAADNLDAAWGQTSLINEQNQAILAPAGETLGECRLRAGHSRNAG